MGRHYPDLHSDPVEQHGYYYSKKFNKLARLKVGDRLPRHMGPWEFIASDDAGSSSQVLQKLRHLHPTLDPYRLTFSTATPIDLGHMARTRRARLVGYGIIAAGAAGLGLFFARRRIFAS
ncbi:hypothetical protein [Vulgatibacter incomptus]|uniref:Uncharacterized protein n=1 Tax=Vulgatibacter incomptus TaxID=1391653 RepID=A0A0K1P964_9BACT|nr:hypothetical protein [Vulgatibacter incomptus]AKU90047.1 hypothetical protein AKJ08_0434 [Vulgatibacter incomptus]